MINRATVYLLNLGHALDHMFLLIFATAVAAIAQEFGMTRWEDLMPYGAAAFFFFGIGSLPAGRLGDLWGRRPMMIVFFVGIGASALLVAAARSPMQLALTLALLGAFASIYHPVGIPMIVQGAARPGWRIGVNGLAGNLGLALAAVLTGWFVKHYGWRTAFVVPGVLSIACGVLFAAVARHEEAPARRKPSQAAPSSLSIARLLFIMTTAATSASLLFNFSTNSNYELLADRFGDIAGDPARIGLWLAAVYAVAALTQLLVGRMIDRYSMKSLYLLMTSLQVVFLAAATLTERWGFLAMQLLFMAAIFGAIPFTDAMIVRYVDDRLRSRVAGMRLAVSLGASSLAVWLIGPVVKQAGFTALLWVMAGVSAVTWLVVTQLPADRPRTLAAAQGTREAREAP